ncbi:unnamed protein product [Rhodiola kirilowii]
MGTKVQCKSYLPGHHPMGDLNDDANIGTWPVYYGDKASSNGQFHDPNLQRSIADAYFGYHTESVRQKVLEHEMIFKTQLYELHRLYKVQRELMDDLKMNELQKQSMAIETSMSSCSVSQRQDAPRWLSSSSSAKPASVGANNFHSTPNFLSGKSQQNGLISPSNASSSKDCELEILECRSSKARRKFNLELRADECIDIEEPTYHSDKPSGVANYPSNGSSKDPLSISTKMFLGGSTKVDRRRDEARQSKGENGLVDLNEQIHIKGLNSSSLNIFGCDSDFRSKPQLQTLHRDNSHYGRDDSRSRNLTMAQKENGREWSHMLESGSNKLFIFVGHQKSFKMELVSKIYFVFSFYSFSAAQSKGQTTVFSQNFLPENIKLFNKGHGASYLQTNQIKVEYWKERSEGGSNHFKNGFFNGLGNPHRQDKSFSASKPPWEKPNSCVTQKSKTAEVHPCFNTTSTLPPRLQSSSKNDWTLGEGWHVNSNSGKTAYQNRIHKGSCSASGPAHRPTAGFDYLNRSNQNGSIDLKGLTTVDASSAKGIDLNAASIGDNHDYVGRPNRDHAADLPWLKSRTGFTNGNGTIQSSNSAVTRQNTGPASSPMENTAERIMGVPFFGELHLSKRASSCRSSLSKEEEMETNGKIRGFDMNLPCEFEEKDTEAPVVNGMNHIDLNMCLVDEDDAVMAIATPKKTIRGFDLEAPGEIDEDLIQLDEGLVTAAAEAIVAILSRKKLTLTETPARNFPEAKPDILEWFVNIISSCPDDADKVLMDKSEDDSQETDSVDYYEQMTLQLLETKEDEYLPDYPKPPEPEEQTGGGPYTTRTRKGQARRGRPRRDFQRDILPGLTSLARHEVTEDLQTFGGLMRATGHSWQSSLTRRAGPRRGRPRLTPVKPPYQASRTCSSLPPKKPEPASCPASSSPFIQKRRTITTANELINMEDHRSLTGWGKTTRRPRRQRCSTTAVVQQIA